MKKLFAIIFASLSISIFSSVRSEAQALNKIYSIQSCVEKSNLNGPREDDLNRYPLVSVGDAVIVSVSNNMGPFSIKIVNSVSTKMEIASSKQYSIVEPSLILFQGKGYKVATAKVLDQGKKINFEKSEYTKNILGIKRYYDADFATINKNELEWKIITDDYPVGQFAYKCKLVSVQ